MIIVGGPDPVSIGSWIEENFFLATNKTKFPRLKEVVKVILITFFLLLLFTAVGDLLMLLLNFHSRVAFYLPNRSLTGSVIHVFSNLILAHIIWQLFHLSATLSDIVFHLESSQVTFRSPSRGSLALCTVVFLFSLGVINTSIRPRMSQKSLSSREHFTQSQGTARYF